jgi:hypothetical protein
MRHRGDLGLHQRCPMRALDFGEPGGQRIHAVERVQVTEKLGRKALVLDDRLGSPREAWVAGEPGPSAAARALQVDRGDLPVSRCRTGLLGFQGVAHARRATVGRALGAGGGCHCTMLNRVAN